jgi:hypothetical protein
MKKCGKMKPQKKVFKPKTTVLKPSLMFPISLNSLYLGLKAVLRITEIKMLK